MSRPPLRDRTYRHRLYPCLLGPVAGLQEVFDSPERYGKGLDWSGYTVHDAANVLRRYLNQLPEPIVPLEFYERFREGIEDLLKVLNTLG
jgi:hypothetical protein